MRKSYALIFLLLLLGAGSYAQVRVITGTVTDSVSKETLIGVTITIKGSKVAAATDVDGKFSIKTSNLENVTIGAKYIGYKYQEITLKAGVMKCNIKLEPVNSTLNEVIVTGYGTTLKSKLLGAVSEIKAADVVDLPVANLGTALRDRVVGIGVEVPSGKPGATTTLSVRNPVTFSCGLGTTADPLYVIDDLISLKSDFDNLDASLIESISFLKDSQAAIYGAAGDKGVVLVTTKRGKPGKPQISYTAYYGTSNTTEKPKMMSAYQQAQFLNDDWALSNAVITSRFSQADLDYLATNPNKSWYDELWHSSHTMRHTISLSGGTDKVTFFAGGSYYNEGGNIGNISITKWNIRSGMTAKLTDAVTAYVSLNTNYSTNYDNGAKSENANTENYVVKALLTTPGWVPLTINGQPAGWNGPNPPGFWNPLAYFNSGSYSTSASQALNLNSSIEWRPHILPGFTAKIQYGKTNYSGNGKNYYPSYKLNQYAGTGQNGLLYSNTVSAVKTVSNSDQILEGTNYTNNYQLNGSLDYSRSINKHTFDVMVVAEQTESTADAFQMYRTTQQIPGVDQFFAYNAGTTTLQTTAPAESGKLSYLVKANYDFANKYLVQFIGREDGSANFPSDIRWGFFPSVALGWRVSEEPFFKNYLSKYINTLKLRFNMGLVGDERVNPYQYLSHYTPYSGTMLFGGSVVNGLDNGILPNTAITWEHLRTQNFGVDATFLDNRLTVSVDVWSKYIYDGFFDVSQAGYPMTLGVNSGIINYGSMSQWGTDFTVGWLGTINKDMHWNVNMIFGFSNSMTLQQYYNANQLGTFTQNQNIVIGELGSKYTGSNYGLIATGIIRTQDQLNAILAQNPNYTIEGKTPQLGYMNFEDVNHDGKIDQNDIVPMYDRLSPWLSTGLTFGLSYKALSFNINGHLSLGGKVFVGGQDVKAPTTTVNGPAFWADHWTPSNPNAAYPRADAPDAGSASTFWVRNGTTGYINNASLSYTLPQAWAQKFKIPALRLIVSGTNLWEFINPYDFKDSRETDVTAYPTLRTISLGINATL